MPVAAQSHILELWFGPAPERVPEDRRARWWRKDPSFDDEIRARFMDTWRAAAAGELDDWAGSPMGRVALLLVLDQFSRNLWRQDARAWAQDPKAQQLCVDGLDAGVQHALPTWPRLFLVMPLMHAEDLALQERCVAELAALAELDPAAEGNLKYARMHRDVISEYGRFPHRNAVLGRETTPAEQAYLDDGGGF